MWNQYKRIAKENAAILLFSQMPFGSDLIQSNRKMFRYEWIWEKYLAAGFLNSHKMPLRAHENILVFYRKLPTYNPQMSTGKPYIKTRKTQCNSSNYRKLKNADYVSVNNGERYPRDVLKYHTPYSSGKFTNKKGCFHPTQKPIDLLEYLIKTYTNEGETVLDNCMGSGSTAVACVNNNRKFIGFETDKKYFEIAKHRIKEAQADKINDLTLFD